MKRKPNAQIRIFSWPARLFALALIPVVLITSAPGNAAAALTNSAATGFPKPVRTPSKVKVNMVQPKTVAAPLTPQFGSRVTDQDLFRARVFEEPLFPMGGKTTSDENAALAAALKAYQQGGGRDHVEPILAFLRDHPASPWKTSLLTDLGIVYFRTGWFLKALDAWQQAWRLGKTDTTANGSAIVDRAVAEYAQLNARLGRFDELEKIFKEVGDRELHGPAFEKMAGAKQGYWLMMNRPQDAFRCGPMALDSIRQSLGIRDNQQEKIRLSRSTPKGMSLTQVADLSRDLKMGYVMAKRRPGAPVILPSVVNWKAGHYAALVRKENGLYLAKDPTFGDDFWVGEEALNAESTGYYLVPKGKLTEGWESVSRQEGDTVWGKGNVGVLANGHTGSGETTCGPCEVKRRIIAFLNNFLNTVADLNGFNTPTYRVHAAVVSLNLVDAPLHYTPPKGPDIGFAIAYSQREIAQPAIFSYSNLGPKWTFGWLSYVQDDPANPSADSKIYLQGGGLEDYTGFNSGTQSYAPQLESRAVLVRISATSYERRLVDGSKEIYSQPDGASTFPRKVFMTQWIDATGNTVQFTYDSNLRLIAVTDALGQVTTLSYQNSDPLKITRVTDPFGRHADFQYNSSGRLSQITDMGGLATTFTYGSNDFITAMTTPYGTTTFSMGEDGVHRWVEVTDPLGEKERTEFINFANGVPFSQEPVPSQFFDGGLLAYRNTFFWDKKAMHDAPGQYSAAHIHHWLHQDLNSASSILESEKFPLENRVWYRYPGQGNPSFVNSSQGNLSQSQPSQVVRVLGDGFNQKSQFEYNDQGRVTKATDPAGRQMSYAYSTDGLDLLSVRQTTGTNNELLASFTYNSQHLPLTATDASGQTTTFTYNTVGQLLTVTNAKNETTTLAYDSNGYLQSVTGPLAGSTTSFTYDGFGRVRTVTDSEGYTVTTDYDNLNRPTLVTYPDGTFEQIVYDKLDPIQTRDRLGRWTRTFYDAVRRPSAVQDALGRITNFNWCKCGDLESISDALGNITHWERDLEGRVTEKTYPDKLKVTYTYEAARGLLSSVTDAKGQTASYQYLHDNNLQQVSYANAQNATPSVSYTYDASYNRVLTMVDGTGTTTYAYNPITTTPALGAGRLASIDGPLSNDTITYSYDQLGRVLSRAINSVSSGVTYDTLGRVTAATNVLGSFSYAYTNTTARLSSVTYPNGQTTTFDYFNNNGDQRLKTIHNKNNAANTISKFDYEYDAEGQIKKWTQQADASTPVAHEFTYDQVDQLISATLKNTSTSAILKRYVYGYDKAGNRTTEQIDSGVTTSSYNNLNQLTGQQSGGALKFKGTVSEPAQVSVGGNSATVSTNNVFEGKANVSVGTNVVAVAATDYSSNSATNRYQVVVGGRVNKTLTYDANGNLTSDGTRTFEWDAADRLIKITQGTHTIEFTYDGLSRRVRMLEKNSGSTVSDRRFLWVGTEIAEERDSGGGMVVKRFFGQGIEDNGTIYFYTRDHLGSIREVMNSANAIQARYEFDPSGRRTKVSGSYDADFGFTGHFHLQPSWMADAINLTLYRIYLPELARWGSRDRWQEREGLNLYRYASDDPANRYDELGLYVTYDSGGDARFWRRFERAFNLAWQTPTGRKLLEYAYSSDQEFRFGPFKTCFGDLDIPGRPIESVDYRFESAESAQFRRYISLRFSVRNPILASTLVHATKHGEDRAENRQLSPDVFEQRGKDAGAQTFGELQVMHIDESVVLNRLDQEDKAK